MVGERQEGLGHLSAVHLQAAHHEIQTQHTFDISRKVVVILQHIGNGGIEIAARTLRERHLLVIVHGVVATQLAYKAQEVLLRTVKTRGEDIGDDYGSGIDEWIARLAKLKFELDKRVERRPRRLPAHTLPYLVALKTESHGQ